MAGIIPRSILLRQRQLGWEPAQKGPIFGFGGMCASSHDLPSKPRIIIRMSESVIYLDNNATTPMAAAVAEAMDQCARCQHANPASQHEPGRRARRMLENTRDTIIELLGGRSGGTDPDRLIFTSGATEANNLALLGMAGSVPGRVLLSAIEHPSVSRAAGFLAARGFEVRLLPVDRHGNVRLDQLVDLINEQTRLVSVIWGNHETGVLQPIKNIADVCREFGIPLHTDAVQVAGKIPITFRELGMAALTISSHKFHGPKGIGGLLLRPDTTVQPILYGGFQQAGLRPGTQSVELAIGMKVALELGVYQDGAIMHTLRSMRERLEKILCENLPGTIIHSQGTSRVPHTSLISFSGCDRQAVVMALDQVGIACATGSACESGSTELSPTLLAMGCDRSLVRSAIRLSVGNHNTVDEIDEAARRIVATIKHLRQVNCRSVGVEAARRRTRKTLQ